tara:strand:- start:336 stop:479 length:144 start_codon:yes stop_codon:yes gene_type:complete
LIDDQSYARLFNSYVTLDLTKDLFPFLTKKQKLNLLKKWQQYVKVLS